MIPSQPARLVFLDFDGVLHPGISGTFLYAADLVAFLLRHPDVGVVFSTNWREDHSLPHLAALLAGLPANRCVGATPILTSGPALREREIQDWLSTHGFRGPWAALDDDVSLFTPGCPHLVRCDPARGIRQVQLEALAGVLQLH